MLGGAQRLSLAPDCFQHGTILHEFMHTLGFYHEENRGDRDDYVRINWDNIIPGNPFFKPVSIPGLAAIKQ